MPLKETRYRNQQILDFAAGQPCTVNIAGVCNYNRETTIPAHCNFDGGKMGGKTHDISTAFACSSCHDILDGRVKYDWSNPDEKYFYMGRAVQRTLIIILREKPEILLKGRF